MNFSGILYEWYIKNKRDLPWRHTKDPYLVWVSEVILQQTRVNQGLDYYLKFAKTFPNVESLASASEDQVLLLWQGLGYYSRARNMHQAAKDLVEKNESKLPSTYKGLLEMKGVGTYTASALASICFGEAKAVVDGNVARVIARLYGVEEPVNSTAGKRIIDSLAQQLMTEGMSLDTNPQTNLKANPETNPETDLKKDPEMSWETDLKTNPQTDLKANPETNPETDLKKDPEKSWEADLDMSQNLGRNARPAFDPGTHNQAMMEFGALQCVPSSPNCGTCPLSEGCNARLSGRVDKLPVKIPKRKALERWMYFYIIRNKDQTILIKRNEPGIWRSLYHFPVVESLEERTDEDICNELFGQVLSKLTSAVNEAFPTGVTNITGISQAVRHQLTHLTIHARFIHIGLSSMPTTMPENFIQISVDDLEHYPVPRLMERYMESAKI